MGQHVTQQYPSKGKKLVQTIDQPKTSPPEWFIAQRMDDALRMAEYAQRMHDSFAAEYGFRRQRVNTLKAGDVVRFNREWHTVVGVQPYTDEICSWFRVTLLLGVVQRTESFDDGEYVSVRIDQTAEAF